MNDEQRPPSHSSIRRLVMVYGCTPRHSRLDRDYLHMEQLPICLQKSEDLRDTAYTTLFIHPRHLYTYIHHDVL